MKFLYALLHFLYSLSYSAGAILADKSLSGLTDTAYDLFIYVYDGHTLVGPRSLTIKISGKPTSDLGSNDMTVIYFLCHSNKNQMALIFLLCKLYCVLEKKVVMAINLKVWKSNDVESSSSL